MLFTRKLCYSKIVPDQKPVGVRPSIPRGQGGGMWGISGHLPLVLEA